MAVGLIESYSNLRCFSSDWVRVVWVLGHMHSPCLVVRLVVFCNDIDLHTTLIMHPRKAQRHKEFSALDIFACYSGYVSLSWV